MVQLKKKVLSHVLLAIYMMVVVHQSVWHSHTSEFVESTPHASLHQHEDLKDEHHEHDFDIGIFHFLEHFLENINHLGDLGDEHLLVIKKCSTKKTSVHSSVVTCDFQPQHLLVLVVDAESLPDPPYHLFLLQKLGLPNTPLRAPPSLV